MAQWQSIFFNQIIASIFDAGASLILVLLIFKVFRVRNPATRFLFLFLPLLKSFIVLIDRSAATIQSQPFTKPIRIGLRMPDPLNLIANPPIIPILSELERKFTFGYSTSVLTTVLLVTVTVVFILLIARWVQLFTFLNGFKKESDLRESDYPDVYATLDTLVAKLGIKRPRLVISNIFQFVPFSVGYRHPIIVLSQDLLNAFPLEQLEIMLAHELAHIKRNDNLTGWIALILRDIMFFDPITYRVYRRLEEEKEKTCDRLALESTGVSPKALAGTLLDVAIFYQKAQLPIRSLNPAFTKGFLYRESTLERRVQAITGPLSEKKSSIIRKSLKVVAFILLLYVQPTLSFKLGELVVFLR